MRFTGLQIGYAVLAIVGVLVTWYWNIQFMGAHGGFSLMTFVTDNYVNAASASISNDILIATATFAVWSFFEARRLQMRHWWAYLVLTLAVAIAFAFPLFLLMRERRLAALNRA